MDIAVIKQMVGRELVCRIDDMESRKRDMHITFCRQVAMYLARELTGASFPSLGREFGREHATIIHSCGAIKRRMDRSEQFRLTMERLINLLVTEAELTTPEANGWSRAYYHIGCCSAVDCLSKTRWGREIEINGVQYQVYACDKHAGAVRGEEQ